MATKGGSASLDGRLNHDRHSFESIQFGELESPMAAVPLQKRPNDFFVSYGHADKARVDPIVHWLRHEVGLKMWNDALSGNAAERTVKTPDRGHPIGPRCAFLFFAELVGLDVVHGRT